MRLGCLLNCPVASRLDLLVAAYSAEDSFLIAAAGRYRSPVSRLGLPLFVRQSCFVHRERLCCDLLRPPV